MAELIETVFENIDKQKGLQCLDGWVANGSKVQSVNITTDRGQIDDSSETFETLHTLETLCMLFVNLNELKTEHFAIPKISVMLERYNSQTDLTFLFDQGQEDIDLYHAFCAHLAKCLLAANYFCGLDPATDRKTQFFCNDQMGPLTYTQRENT